ncbi:FAD/NAD(P)-binding protein [Sinomonas mesophila]|uniref:FAD/NAD(P)-binding protein n=1 Tax=Sinomonas mesophila TaxID=1531955 RepID=UPI000987A5E4|nr:FAD/NAD(P)-binding protein [Sinomonas mesophila]
MRPAVLAVIGGGPRAAMLLERLAANLPAHGAVPHGPGLEVHVVEPHGPGSGRIWRRDQSPLVMLNSRAVDITCFTDASVECGGPAVDGPSLLEWAQSLAGEGLEEFGPGRYADAELLEALAGNPGLAAEAAGLDEASFPTRRLASLYLEWFFRRAARSLEARGVRVRVHRDTAVGIEACEGPARPGAAVVRLAGGTRLAADAVLLALGHTDAEVPAPSSDYAAFAERHGLAFVGPGYTTELDLSALTPGRDVIVSGLGLAFVDLVVMLFEGHGGRFVPDPTAGPEEGALRYEPSGREPRLLAGSRRGVPYHSKVRGALQGEAPGALRFLTADAVAGLLAEHEQLDFGQHLWPLIASDVEYASYRELFTGHPHRVALPWVEFSERFVAAGWRSPERAALVAAAVPDPEDRVDLEALDRPLAGLAEELTGSSPGPMHDGDAPARAHLAVVRHILRDLRLRDSGEHSETLGLFLGILRAYMELGRLVPLDRLTPDSQRIVCGWWHGFFSFVDSGPPAFRLRELLALERAGLLRFLGPDLTVSADEASGLFRASAAGGTVTASADAFVEARLPGPAVRRSANPLVTSLVAEGLVQEQLLDATEGRAGTGRLLVAADARAVGPASGWLFAVGAGTSSWGAGAFARPRSNAAPFRETDALARTLLGTLSAARPRSQRTQRDGVDSPARLAVAVALLHPLAG